MADGARQIPKFQIGDRVRLVEGGSRESMIRNDRVRKAIGAYDYLQVSSMYIDSSLGAERYVVSAFKGDGVFVGGGNVSSDQIEADVPKAEPEPEAPASDNLTATERSYTKDQIQRAFERTFEQMFERALELGVLAIDADGLGGNEPDPGEMALMLEACRNQFAYYASNHQVKASALPLGARRDDAAHKADVNDWFVQRIQRVLNGGKAGS